MGPKAVELFCRRLQRPSYLLSHSTLKIPQNIWLIRSNLTNWNIWTESALVTDKAQDNIFMLGIPSWSMTLHCLEILYSF